MKPTNAHVRGDDVSMNSSGLVSRKNKVLSTLGGPLGGGVEPSGLPLGVDDLCLKIW